MSEQTLVRGGSNTSDPGAPHQERSWRGFALRLPGMQRLSALYLLALIVAIFAVWTPSLFLSQTTLTAVAADQVIVAILGLALLIPLTAGEFDLSVGAMAAFSLVIVSKLQEAGTMGIVPSGAVALLACIIAGWLNAFLIVRLKINSFIATLGSSQVLVALGLYLSANQQIFGVFPEGFLKAGRTDIFGVPIVVAYLLVLALIVWYVMEWTQVGRHLFATGANVEAARLSGVRTDRLVYGSFVTSALIAGIAGLVYGARVGSFSNTFAPAYLFPAFAAVFLGATQFNRRPNVWGTLLAVYTLALGVKGLQLTASSGVYWITPMFNGLALVIAVGFAARSLRSRSVRAKKSASASAAIEPGEKLNRPATEAGPNLGLQRDSE